MKQPSEIFFDHLLPGAGQLLPVDPGASGDFAERYKKLAQQFAKVMAISDKYQSDVIEMADRLRHSKEELEAAHATLRQSEERFRALTENLPVGVAMVDAELKVLAANPKMRDWFPEVETDFAAFCGSLANGAEGNLLRRIWEDGATRTVEREAVGRSGVCFLRIIGTGVKGGDGKIASVLMMVEDVTEYKRIEQERKEHEAREREHQKTESLHRMASAVAHHFNNQLHAVMGHLELALGDMPMDGEHRKSLEEALRAARTASEMSVLMRRYVGEGIFAPDAVDLADMVRRRLPALERNLPGGCELIADLPEPGPTVQGKAENLGQILANLVTNAGEACAERADGRVEVRVETVDSARVPLSRCLPVGWNPASAQCACLTVRDNGNGISPEDLDKIFEPFFSRKFTGRGIGLALVAGLLRGHDAGISVESAVGEGSVFRCYFPLE